MNIYVINGPSLDLLGIREPALYGSEDYATLCRRIAEYCEKKTIGVKILQSNHEGDLVDAVREAYFAKADGIVLNAAAYTHTSVALFDVLSAVKLPTVEVHITDPDAREDFRRVNFIRPACFATVKGHGTDGYLEAIDLLEKRCAT